MNIDLLFGKQSLSIHLSPDWDVSVIRKKPMPILADAKSAIAAALASPVTVAPLAQEAKGARSACILICDITRPVPNGLFLPILVRQLLDAGIAADKITILVATGLHRPNEGDEMRELVGDDWVMNTVNVANHFARNDEDHVDLGSHAARYRGQNRSPFCRGRYPHRHRFGRAPLHGGLVRRPQGDRAWSCA